MVFRLRTNLTGSTMKRTVNILTAAVLWTAAVFGLNSCIFDALPADKFYGSAWESTEAPLGPFPAQRLTLEFLCGNTIYINTDIRTCNSYGTYCHNEQTAVFENLSMESEGHLITFIDAQLSGSTLFLRWRIDESVDPFTTAMHRVSTTE